MGLCVVGCQAADEAMLDDGDVRFREGSVCVTVEDGAVVDAMLSTPPKNQNFGALPVLRVGGKDESLLRFDLSTIPTGVVVERSTLNLYSHSNSGQSPINIHAVTAAWDPATVSYASFDQRFSGEISGILQPTSPGVLKSTGITGLVIDWLSGARPNHGVLLETTSKTKTTFVSNDAADNGMRPSLEVCYRTPIDDACSPDPCLNGGTCTNTEEGYTCECAPGFEGTNCETDIDDCAPAPCQNGGSCVDEVMGYACECADGYTGSHCETNIDDCAAAPCLHGGICTDAVAGYTCICDAGFSGPNCEIDIDDCAPAPCQNGGTCTDQAGDYACACVAGFTGENCEIDVDDCAGQPCQSGGTCIDGANTYSCECAPGFTGANCELTIGGCTGEPCLNGGFCTVEPSGYSCACAAGYAGTNCEIDVDDCAAEPCQNGGLCIDGVDTYSCQCPIGFAGDGCELTASQWCPQESSTTLIDGTGGTVHVLGVTVALDGLGTFEAQEVRVAIHGEQLNPAALSSVDSEHACTGGVVEVIPIAGASVSAVPTGTLTLPCSANDDGVFYVEHARIDGTYANHTAVCDELTGEASFSFTGYGHFTVGDTVVPGCETCPLGQGVAVCDVDSWWPPRGECYAAPDTFVEGAIGPDGGVLVHPSGATLTVPAGAVAEPRTFSLDIAWELLPHQRLVEGAIPPWRVLTAEREGWFTELAVPASLTFDCGPEPGRLLVEHRYELQQQIAVDCVAGQATIALDRVGYVEIQGVVETSTIGAGGGSVTAANGAQIVIPAGAVAQPVDVSIVPILDGRGPAIPTRQLGETYAFLPHGQIFEEPVEIRLPAPGCVQGRTAVLVRADEQDTTWTEVPADCVDDVAIISRTSFSVGTPVDTIATAGGACGCLCGEDVRNDLTAVAAQAIQQWRGATQQQRIDRCGRLEFTFPNPVPSGGTGRITKNGWDIGTLAFSESKTFGNHPNTQRATVSVDGQCYFAGEVNYFLWGVTEHLCDSINHGLLPGLSAAAIWKHRADSGDARRAAPGRVSWTNAGYGAIRRLDNGTVEVNSAWSVPRRNVTLARDFAQRIDGAAIDCEPVPTSQPYRGAEGPFVWRWGGSAGEFRGTVGVTGTPSPAAICASDDAAAAPLGEQGVLIAIAPNDEGIYADLGLNVQASGAFEAVATHDVGGIPHVEVSSQIPTAFAEIETLRYEYQPEGGGIPENLDALIEITPTCPIPEGDRPSEYYCGCGGGREWNEAEAECGCPNGASWDATTGQCVTDPCAAGLTGHGINPANGQCQPLDVIVVSGTGEHCGASDVHWYVRAFNGSGSYSLVWSGSPPGPPNPNGSPAYGNWRGFSIVDDVTGQTYWSNCCVYNDVGIVSVQPGPVTSDCSGISTCRCGGHTHCGYVN